jgi:hypothetical protein
MFHTTSYYFFFFCTAAATKLTKIGCGLATVLGILDGIAPKKRMIFNFYNLNQSGIWFTPVASNPAFAIVLHNCCTHNGDGDALK